MQSVVEAAKAGRPFLDYGRGGFGRLSNSLADYIYWLNDREGLDRVFQRCFAECTDVGDRYIAYIDYAATLERFGDPEAEAYYRQAIATRNNTVDSFEAYNRLSVYLQRMGRKQEALDLWNQWSAQDLQALPSAVATKRRLMNELGLDAANANASPAQPGANNPIGLRRQ
jgi:tetratricopeptide (TPR) repeat protein